MGDPAEDLAPGTRRPASDRRSAAPYAPRLALAALALAVLAGLGLRLYALGHGLPHQYVPDESTMVGGALRMGAARSLQPPTFIYPALLMYIFAAEYLGLLAVGRVIGLFASVDHFRDYAFADPTLFYLLPRLAIALAGAATIPLAYLLGRRLYGPWAGVAAATLISTSVMHVQMSHQARHWVPVALLALAVLWVSLDLAERGRRRDYLLSGLLVGLAAATSFNGVLLLVLPSVAHLIRLRGRGRALHDPSPHLPFLQTALLASALFLALNPYILLRSSEFGAFHSSRQHSIFGQILDHFEAFSWRGFGFFAEATLAYEPALTLLGIAGAGLAVARFRCTAALVLVYPVLHYVAFATTAPSLEQRYMLPAVVLWALPAGLAGARALEWLRGRLGRGREARSAAVATGLVALLLAGLVALPSLRYDWLLSQTDTRTLAKGWIESAIPSGEEIVVESYPPPLTASPEALRAQQLAEPGSLGARDQWILDRGLPPDEAAYRLVRLNLVDTSPAMDQVSPYLATHRHRYFVVTDFRWKSDHLGHQALRAYLDRNGRLIGAFSPSQDAGYVPSDLLNNLEAPLLELWRVERPGPRVEIYEVPQ